jgi:hypothetical protein
MLWMLLEGSHSPLLSDHIVLEIDSIFCTSLLLICVLLLLLLLLPKKFLSAAVF